MRTFRDILAKADEVQGVPFGELAVAHGIQWSDYPARRKGLPGQMAEAVFGVPSSSRPLPDMDDWGIEIKTVPVSPDLRVQERTKITSINPQDLRAQDWGRSTVFRKLRNILFVPVVKVDKDLPVNWYFRTPFIWMPSVEVEQQLERDYEEVRALVVQGRPDLISSAEPPEGQGHHLIASTSGANAADHVDWGSAGQPVMERRRAWWFRKEFVQSLVEKNVRYDPARRAPPQQAVLPMG